MQIIGFLSSIQYSIWGIPSKHGTECQLTYPPQSLKAHLEVSKGEVIPPQDGTEYKGQIKT